MRLVGGFGVAEWDCEVGGFVGWGIHMGVNDFPSLLLFDHHYCYYYYYYDDDDDELHRLGSR